jgi:hypothetical protein
MLPVATVTLPLVTLPVADTCPAVTTLPPTTLPDTLARPVTIIPVVANTATFDTPPTVMLALPLITGISMLVVPLKILSALMLPTNTALPVTVRLPTMLTF